MDSKWARRLGRVALAGSLAWVAVGCAEERDPINRVQANALPKSFFVGQKLEDTSDDPEFYIRNTVVDVPYGAAQDGLFTASYAQPVSRIKWEIQEEQLIGRQTYERINDSDHKGSRRTNDGQIVAVFRIEQHFDVRRDYNPGTGEETNTIVENSSDRPWYQRAYMRVDWSQNLVTDGYLVDTLSQIGLYGGVKYTPIQYHISDKNDPNAPVFDAQNSYFDVTTKAFATPQMVDTPWGAFPACYFYGVYPVGNCNPTELTLRLSFKRVVDTDFEPSDWDGNRMEAFGWFYDDRYGFDRNYGVVDQKWHRLAAKHNIWERSHISQKGVGPDGELFAQCNVDYWRDANGDVMKFRFDEGKKQFLTDASTGLPIPDPNGKPFTQTNIATTQLRDAPGNRFKIADQNENKTDDECEFFDGNKKELYAGSRCDTIRNRCTLPLAKRETKTRAWYYAPGSAQDLYSASAGLIEQWNVSLKQAVNAGRYAEAKRLDQNTAAFVNDLGDPLSEADILAREAKKRAPTADEWKAHVEDGAALPKDVREDLFVFCHSPVAEGDHPECGKPGLLARIGDLRYNSMNMIDIPQMPSPWGIMVDAVDPITGEVIAASANEWTQVLDSASKGLIDVIRWRLGEISDAEIQSGQYMKDWFAASKGGAKAFEPDTMTKDEIESRLVSIQADKSFTPSRQVNLNDLRKRDGLRQITNARLREANQQLGAPLDSRYDAAKQALKGTKFETMLMGPEILQAAGLDPNMPAQNLPQQVLDQVSPIRGKDPRMQRWLENMKAQSVASSHSCTVEAPEAEGTYGLARQAAKLFPLPDKNDGDYAAKKHKRDADMWKWAREQMHVAVMLHEVGHSMGLRHNFVSNFDALNFHDEYWQLRTRNGQEKACALEPVTTDLGRLNSYATPHTNGEDCVGPRWVDPVTQAEEDGIVWKWGGSTVMDYPGDITQDMLGLGKYDKAAIRFGYANVVDVDQDTEVHDAKRLDGLDAAGMKREYYLSYLDGFGGITGPIAPGGDIEFHYSQMQDKFQIIRDCAPIDESNPSTSALGSRCQPLRLDHVSIYDMKDDVGPFQTKPFAVDPQNRVRHPYMFGSDEYADHGNIYVHRFDAGADPFEQMQYITSNYENRYVFTHFRRNNVLFNTGGVVGRVEGRVFEKMTGTTKGLGLYLSIYPEFAEVFKNAPGYMQAHALASEKSLETFIRILMRPEPGKYYFPRRQGRSTSLSCDNVNQVTSRTTLQIDDGDRIDCATREPYAPDYVVSPGSGQGRFLHNEYDYNQGYNWSDYQLQVGSFYEKIYVLYYLMEAYNNFLQNSKDDYIDGRSRNLNYASIYPEQMRRLFAALMQGDTMSIAPFVLDSGTGAQGATAAVQYLPWDRYGRPETTNLSYPANAARIDPLIGWEQQYRFLLFGFIYGQTTLTMDWVQQARVWSPGGGRDGITIPAAEQVRYTDPLTGVLYVARNYGTEVYNGRYVPKSTGARMVQYALDTAKEAFDFTEAGNDVVWTHTSAEDASPRCKLASPEACNEARRKIKLYSSNLDLARQLSDFFGTGPL